MELTGYLTDAGKALSAKLLAGTALEITRIMAGSGSTALSASALAAEKQALSAGTVSRTGTTVTLPATLAAAQAAAAYTLQEIGVYAADPDRGEVLCRVYRLSRGVEISPASQLVLRFDLQEAVSESADVSVDASACGLLLYADLEALMGTANGIATLNQSGTVPAAQIPSLAAGKLTSGTFASTDVKAKTGTDYTTARIRNIQAGTTDLTAGTSELSSGNLYFVYE